jgi:hypothetical protein
MSGNGSSPLSKWYRSLLDLGLLVVLRARSDQR